MDPSALLQKLDGGDISNIVHEVKTALAGRGHSSFAHRVIVRISNLCVKRRGRADPVIIDDNEALQLVLLCVRAIDVDSNDGSQIHANHRTIAAVKNVLSRFRGNGNIAFYVKTLDAFLPVMEKMSGTMSDQEYKIVTMYVTCIQNILMSSSSIFEEDPQNEIPPLNLWNLMLRVCALVNTEKFIFVIFSVMKSMSEKYENRHASNSYEKVLYFNEVLLERFITFSEVLPFKFDGDEDEVNNFFGVLITTLWQFIRAHVKSGSISNSYKTLNCMSKYVTSFLRAHSHHIVCFNLITRMLRTFSFYQDKHSSDEKYFIGELQHFQKVLEESKSQGVSPSFRWVIFIAGRAVASFLTTEIQTIRTIFTLEHLTVMHHFIKLLAELLETSSTEACKAYGQTCSYKGDASLAAQAVNKFVILSVECMKDNQEGLISLLPLIESSLALEQSIIDKAVKGKCVKAEMLQDLFCDTAYNMGNLCFNTSNWKCCQILFKQPLKYLYCNKKDLSAIEKQRVFCILSRLLVAYEKQELTEEAKVSALLHVILHLKLETPQHPFVCKQWTSLQNADPANVKTTVDVLKHKSLLLKSICPEFDFDVKLVPSLLLWELSCYTSDRMNSSDIILNAWLALKATKASPLMLLEGSVMACQALFSYSDKVNWCDILSESVFTWFSQVNTSEKAVSLCLMALHYQIKFLMQAQKHFDENESKVEEVAVYSQNPALVRQPQDVVNPGDVCQVRSTFPNLNLQREQKLMDLLDTALNYWNDSLQAGLCSDHLAMHPSVTSSGEYLLQIGFHYTLWGYNTGAAKAFQMCWKFAKKMNIDDLQLQALSGLMNVVEVKNELIAEADALLVRLKDHNRISYLTLCYHTSRAFQALRTAAYTVGMNVLQEVVNVIPSPSAVWCHAYARLLQASYSVLPKSKMNQTQPGGSISALQGLSYCVKTIQSKRLSDSPLTFAALVNQELSTSLWIGRYFLSRQMPKQARNYMKTELMLALKLGLATRAAEFICELAFVDLLSEKVEEASAKIIDLQCILGKSETSSDNGNHGDAMEECDDVCTLQPVPCSKSPSTNLGASPILESNEVFRLPISHHGSSCKCYMCRNYSVQNTWLMYSHLQAKINLLRFDVHKSYDIYKKALRAARFVLQKLSRPTCPSGLFLQQHQVACTEICLRLDFVDMLFIYGKDTEASKGNSTVLEALKHLKTDENQLFGGALEQKMCILKIRDGKKKKDLGKGAVKIPEGGDNHQTSPGLLVEKTPEQSAYIRSPLLPGKRQPLKPVEAANRLVVPSTEKQFFTPKAKFNFVIHGPDSDNEPASQTSEENVSSSPLKFHNPRTLKFEGDENTAQSSSSQEIEKTEEMANVKNTTYNKLAKPTRGSKAKTEDDPAAPKKGRRAATSVSKVTSSEKNSGCKATDTANDALSDKFVVPPKTGTTKNPCNVSQKTVPARNARLASSRSIPTNTKSNLECSGSRDSQTSKAVGFKVRKDAVSKIESTVAAAVSSEPKRQTRQRKT